MGLNANRLALLLGCSVTMAGLISSVTSGCSNNGAGSAVEEAGTDGTTDSAGDVMAVESSADAPGADGGGTDAMDAAVGIDAPPGSDSGASDSSDFVDVGDVQVDVPTITGFPHALDMAYCTRLQQCCLVPPSQWNQTGPGGCVTLFDTFGAVFRIGSYAAALDSGLVTYDPNAAGQCLTSMLSFNCGTLNSAGINQEQALCYSAVKGTLGADAGPCVNSLECNAGEYCGSSTGICEPLGTVGAPCSDFVYSTDCTYLGIGTPAEFCERQDGGGGICKSALALGADCQFNQWCQSLTCDNTCGNQFVFSDPGVPNGTCAMFTITDAGGD